MTSPSVPRPWLAGWFGLLLIALLNGTVRATVLQPRLGEDTARRVATAVLLAAVTVYVRRLQRRYPLPDAEQAWTVGLAWMVMTLGFEFGIGRLVARQTWSELVADYDVTAGRTWVLVPLWIAAAPAVMRRPTPGPRPTDGHERGVRHLPPITP
ncbi:hypothetical protein [Actinomycetospora chlora]|uniref:hypothetical protein n=1 Tax=Actinomycetospora chlora TaxID=663608 RepID=UPI0031E4FFCA